MSTSYSNWHNISCYCNGLHKKYVGVFIFCHSFWVLYSHVSFDFCIYFGSGREKTQVDINLHTIFSFLLSSNRLIATPTSIYLYTDM